MKAAWRDAGRESAALRAVEFTLGCVLAPGEAADSPRAKAQAGTLVAAMLHGLVETPELDRLLGRLPPAIAQALTAYRTLYQSYQPADARYLTLHRGHLMRLRPEEESLITGDLLRALAWVGTEAELRERVAALEAAGYTQIAIQVVEGHEARSRTGRGSVRRAARLDARRGSSGSTPTSPRRHQPTLEVLALEVGHSDRMVGAGPERIEQNHPSSRLDRGGEEDLAKELRIDGGAAAEGEQEAARRQVHQRLAIEVLVGARAGVEVGAAAHQRRRIADDEIEAPVETAQLVERVAFDPAHARRVEPVVGEVAAGALVETRRRLHRDHRARPAAQRVQRERSAVGEEVEHVGIAGERLRELAVRAADRSRTRSSGRRSGRR